MRKKTKSRFNFAVNSLAVLIVFTLLAGVTMSQAKVDRNKGELAEKKHELRLAQSDLILQKGEVEAKMDAESIEKYAQDKLGLKKLMNSQIVFITVQEENIIVIPEDKRTLLQKAADVLDRFLEYITN